jgi:hypothetical protein
MNRPQTIQIFLPTGNAQGFKQAEITSDMISVFEIPQRELGRFGKLPEAQQHAVYFLFGEDDDDGSSKCYIGESDAVVARLTNHLNDKDKNWWTRAFVAVSQKNNWTKAHIHYLERVAIDRARRAGRYIVTNSRNGHSASIPAPLQADCDKYFETIELLLSALGRPVLDVPQDESSTPISQRFHLNSQEAKATGTWTSEGMTVFEGSLAVPAKTDQIYKERITERQASLIREGVLEPRGNLLLFTRDHVFSKPSGAGQIVLGRSVNGWIEWRDLTGRSLDVFRKSFEGETDGSA